MLLVGAYGEDSSRSGFTRDPSNDMIPNSGAAYLYFRNGESWVQFVRRAKQPELPVVLLEDVAALTGLVFALIGVGLTILTGDNVWDGVGTIAIGVLRRGDGQGGAAHRVPTSSRSSRVTVAR